MAQHPISNGTLVWWHQAGDMLLLGEVLNCFMLGGMLYYTIYADDDQYHRIGADRVEDDLTTLPPKNIEQLI